jgi:hypothetical protein
LLASDTELVEATVAIQDVIHDNRALIRVAICLGFVSSFVHLLSGFQYLFSAFQKSFAYLLPFFVIWLGSFVLFVHARVEFGVRLTYRTGWRLCEFPFIADFVF